MGLQKSNIILRLRGVTIKVLGSQDSEDAAKYFEENKNLLLPFMIANFLAELSKKDDLTKAAVNGACNMVLDNAFD